MNFKTNLAAGAILFSITIGTPTPADDQAPAEMGGISNSGTTF